MLNVNAITSTLAKMRDDALQKYAAMHKDDPYIMALAVSESNRRKKMRNAAQAPQGMPEPPKVADQAVAEMAPAQQMPEDVGIAQLPAGDMNFADGGIIAFGDGGDVEHYVKGGNTADKVEAFKKRYGALAEETGKRIGVDSNILLAQWALETDYGKRTVGANNLGNIKDLSGKGPKAFDKLEKSNSSYRSYDSPKEFGNDFAGLIERRYPDAKGAGADLNKYVAGMKGYATDKDYGKKLAATLTKFIPIGSANAEPAPPRSTTPTISAPAPTREQMLAQIPGTSRPPAPAPAPVAAPTPTREQMLAQIPGTSRPPAPAPVAASALEALAGEMYPSSVGAAFVPPKSGIRKKPAPAPASAAGLPALTREQMIAQIPGQDGRPVQAQQAAEAPTPTLAERFTAPGAVARTLAQNTLAMPFAPVVAGLSQLGAGPGMSVEDAYRGMLYSPKNPAAQAQLGIVGQVMDDLKIPGYIPSLTPVRGARPPSAQTLAEIEKAKNPRLAPPSPAATNVAALDKAIADAPPAPGPQLANVSSEGQRVLKVNPDRLERQLTPEQLADRNIVERAQAQAARLRSIAATETEAQLAAQAADKARAAAASGRVGETVTNIAGARAINEALPGPAARLGLAGLAGNAAAQAENAQPAGAAGSAPTGIGPGDPGWGADLGQQIVPSDLSKDEKKEIVSAAKETVPDKKSTKGWTSEDWLTLGLNLMATKSSNFMQAVGGAGVAALKSRQERFKEERTALNEETAADLNKARAAQARAQTAELTSDSAKTKQALAAADTMYDNWLNRVKANPVDAINIDQAAADAQYRTFLKRAFGAYNMQVPAGLATSGLTQLSPADLALIERYNKTKP